MTTDLLLIAAGLALLFAGGEGLVRGAVALATRLGLSPLVIGLTVVGFGTSMPELMVSLDAALKGSGDVALGNVIGSNIANVLLILGLSALVWPISTRGLDLRRDLFAMMLATVATWGLLSFGTVSAWGGAALAGGLVIYLSLAMRSGDTDDASVPAPSLGMVPALVLIAVALGALVLGARFLVDGASSIARNIGVSEAYIGLTVVAVGTSLPELATSLVAALRRQTAIALGNVVGSNIFNLFGILGVTALIVPVPVAGRFVTSDLPVLVAVSLLLVFVVARGGLGRLGGAALLVAYAAYTVLAAG
jgi:cation:H+ antiporter